MKRSRCHLIASVLLSLLVHQAADAQQPIGNLFRRVSRASNFEFAIYNNGDTYGGLECGPSQFGYDCTDPAVTFAHWPRGSFHMIGEFPSSIALAVKRGDQLMVSDAGFVYPPLPQEFDPPESEPFSGTVPGRIGDTGASYDSVYQGVGWLYSDDGDYIVYSSLDYDSSGVDVSGSNFNDWPIRLVDGRRQYVADPLARSDYPPVYLSDEDMFCIFKDTDTRFDRWYDGPGGRSEPIGIEVQNSIYSWGEGPGKDIVLFQYEITNKSGYLLDSCFVVYSHGLVFTGLGGSLNNPTVSATLESLSGPEDELPFMRPTNPSEWTTDNWSATEIPPTIGFPVLEAPKDYNGLPQGIKQFSCNPAAYEYRKPPPDTVGNLLPDGNDSIAYRILSDLRLVNEGAAAHCASHPYGPVMNVGPFPMAVDATVRVTFGIIFSDSLSHLILLDDFIRRIYNNNFQRPSPSPTPKLTATGLNRSVKLSWDASAESAMDVIVPDSIGRPFVGYSLQRAESIEGPYKQIGRWHMDTLLVHEYLDRGDSLLGGPAPDASGSGKLKNNVTYYYRLLSFDEGAVRLKLDPMESPATEGVNQIAVIPTTEPANATSEESTGALQAGILGDVTVPVLIPTNTTNFNRLLSGRTISVKLDAVSNGVGYTIPVTITDSIAGREHNAIIDPDLLIHGSTDISGPRTSEATITDVFGIGAADITLSYNFEQLNEPFHIEPSLTGAADVPIIIGDSVGVTGLQLSDPYKSTNINLILAFSPGGIDTGSTIFQRYFSYLKVRLIDATTNTDYTGEWTLSARGVRRTGGPSITWSKTDRYYLSGMISNGEEWDQGHLLTVYNWAIAFDFADHGIGSGKPSPTFIWASPHRAGTVDFQPGDSVRLSWQGGVRAVFPQGAIITLTGAPAGRTAVTQEMMEGIRIVPNPYFIRHEAQRGDPRIYFNYLPEECTIRIYTVALDLVKTIIHSSGSREEWDLTTEGGQLVASQLLIAHVEASNGEMVVKKFAVVVGR